MTAIKRSKSDFEDFMELIVDMCTNKHMNKAVFMFDFGDRYPKMVAFNGRGWDGGVADSQTVQIEDIKMMLETMLESDHFREM